MTRRTCRHYPGLWDLEALQPLKKGGHRPPQIKRCELIRCDPLPSQIAGLGRDLFPFGFWLKLKSVLLQQGADLPQHIVALAA
jgi:hypothetical protein